MSLFGNSTFGKPATSTFGSFGNTANQSTQPATTGTGLFGSFGQQNQSQAQTQQGQQQQPGATTGNSLFPPPNTGTNPLFGGARPTGTLFGSTPSTQPSTGTNAFGTNTTGQGTTGAFGAPTGNPLFGSTNTTQTQPTQGTGLFGQPNQQNTTQPSGTGLFGQPAQPTQSTTNPLLFGQQPQQPQQQQQPSLFGQPQQQPQQSTGLFGSLAQPSTNLGGSTLFGNTQPGNSFLGLSNAGASTSNLFAPKTSLIQTQPQGDSAQAQFIGLVQKIEATAQAWDASSPQCRFQVSLITTCSTEWHF